MIHSDKMKQLLKFFSKKITIIVEALPKESCESSGKDFSGGQRFFENLSSISLLVL